MADLIDRQTIIEAIHSAIYPYFCGAEDGDALSDDEKLVLSVNKAVCTAIKALPSAQPDVPVGDMISRQAAIDEAYAVIVDDAVCDVVPVETLEALPSVDAVEVVRCKDCKHWIPYDWMFSEVWKSQNIDDYTESEIGCTYCDMSMGVVDYCSRGERKDG